MKHTKILFAVLILGIALSGFLTVTSAQQSDTIYVEATVATDILYVRSGPGTGFSQVGQLTLGTVVGILGRNEVNPAVQTWVYVTGGGLEGWVSIAYLQFPDNYILIGVPVLSGGAAPAAPAVTTTGGGSTTVPAGALQARSNDFVNFRTGPGLEFDVIRQYPQNTRMSVIGRNANSVWFNVIINGQAGWVFYSLIDITGDADSLPVTHGAPQQPATTSTTTGTTTTTTAAPAAGSDNTYNIIIGGAPGGDPNNDGRINNSTNLGVALIYCIDSNGYANVGHYRGGGIVVYHFDHPRKGIVFFATEQQINSVGIPSNDVGIKLIRSEGGYTLYRLSNGLFQLNGTTTSGHHFVFKWRDCFPGPAAES